MKKRLLSVSKTVKTAESINPLIFFSKSTMISDDSTESHLNHKCVKHLKI